ncbi:hypothetical protein CPHO_07050 [Corynebacterium phocae]|uniref:Uncharacterized protein n=1 Tax=Corynebacterium phocae TaxID=161895 RepID=A0A1L7D3V5_9CORY|nr:hypothetical protein [Corynebacterium phocae]APT92691.1 hypothetical protein CPHO_07050 [Corynebacterium phocae]KAA8723580.1 hypothetical protein F4V58_06560 [Corynebacterium phocae]
MSDFPGALPADSVGYRISCTPKNGDRFVIAGHEPGGEDTQRVVLLEGGFRGGVSEPDIATTEQPWGLGLVQAGHVKFADMTGSLEVVAWSNEHAAAENFRDWRSAWLSTLPPKPGAPYRPIVLDVVNRAGLGVWTPAVLDSVPAAPDREPRLSRYVKDSISWRSLSGCWFSPVERYSGNFVVVPRGDAVPRCRLQWTGRAGTVRFPDGRRVSLPGVQGGPFFIDLDRGMSGHVTRVSDGVTVPGVWAGLRGYIQGVSLALHERVRWELSPGLELLVENRHFSPWK